MIKFETTILKFASQGEKTGWTYISVSQKIAQQIKPNNKKSFRVKGKIDAYTIEGVALMPMGNGDFILALNAAIRKGIKKIYGAKVVVQLQKDDAPLKINTDLFDCLQDEPQALTFFNTLAQSHQKYFNNWVDAAKTEPTKAKRIAACVNALAKKWDYGLMIRTLTNDRKEMRK
jgi:Domain of unknown function (DUF1905)/Bacteriocin-protection, YdeI or OmpD-Associated